MKQAQHVETLHRTAMELAQQAEMTSDLPRSQELLRDAIDAEISLMATDTAFQEEATRIAQELADAIPLDLPWQDTF